MSQLLFSAGLKVWPIRAVSTVICCIPPTVVASNPAMAVFDVRLVPFRARMYPVMFTVPGGPKVLFAEKFTLKIPGIEYV
ncbi:MAG: hypothetical protein LUQ67_03440 [Methanomicrobiales archaeon]|nr:hypothetical protein [Methanomicrobiales archaeon]